VRRASILLLAVSVLVAGCTYPKTGRFAIPQLVINASSVETAITNIVVQDTKMAPLDVICPTNVTATLGNTFACTYLTNEDVAYRATVRVTDVHGGEVAFDITLARG
jgi:hypothetical protein